MSDSRPPLSPLSQGALILAFGAATAGFVLFIGREPVATINLLLMSGSLGAIATAGLWLWILAASHSRGWNLAFALTFWIPYVNFVVASLFARRYWAAGARAPALLAIAGMLGQTLATLRFLAPGVMAPV